MFLNSAPEPNRRALRAIFPWIFVIGAIAGALLPAPEFRNWLASWWNGRGAARHVESVDRDPSFGSHRRDLTGAHSIIVERVLDGDTFAGRVQLWPGVEVTTKVRLRGIDAAEMSASCASERKRAESALNALRTMLAGGEVRIFNITPDKYSGRVVADVSARDVPNISESLLKRGEVRAYLGGRRQSWCE